MAVNTAGFARQSPFWLATSGGLTTTTFTSAADSTTTPANSRPVADAQLFMQPFGTTAANKTFQFRVNGWTRDSGASQIWIKHVAFEGTATLGARTGISGGQVAATDFYADTISVTTGTPTSRFAIGSPADDSTAYVVLRHLGCERVSFEVATTGSTSTANLLCRWVSETGV